MIHCFGRLTEEVAAVRILKLGSTENSQATTVHLKQKLNKCLELGKILPRLPRLRRQQTHLLARVRDGVLYMTLRI